VTAGVNIGSVAEAAGLPTCAPLAFIKRARSLGFSVAEVRDLLDLWRDRSRKSATVKSLATKHIAALDLKIAELQSMREALAHLVKRCHGDARPDCPILGDLDRSEQ
jgi:MerR family copper efflux transcriptional regulator